LIDRKIKIAHISTPFTWRGGEQQVAYLHKGIEELNALGAFGEVDQWVFCPKGSEMEEYCKQNNVPHRSFRKRSGTDPFSASDLKSFCSELSIDLLHAHDSHAHTMAVLSASIFRNRTPFVLSRRVDFPLKDKAKTRFKYNHKNLRKILCVSDFIKNLIEPHIHNSDIDIVTVHSGVDLEAIKVKKGILRAEHAIGEDQIVVANTSAIAEHKDYFTFADVAFKLNGLHPGKFVFFAIGTGPLIGKLKKYCSDLGFPPDILFFTGFRKDLDELWPDIDIFLFPSKTEGLGTSILDAFRYEVPVVATDTGGIPELIEDRKTGLLCPVGEVNELAKAVQLLASDTNLKKELVAGAKVHLEHFDRKITAQHTLLHYYDALK
jgi:L-malate glycosyltransferase